MSMDSTRWIVKFSSPSSKNLEVARLVWKQFPQPLAKRKRRLKIFMNLISFNVGSSTGLRAGVSQLLSLFLILEKLLSLHKKHSQIFSAHETFFHHAGNFFFTQKNIDCRRRWNFFRFSSSR